jgi:hypothetical protein
MSRREGREVYLSLLKHDIYARNTMPTRASGMYEYLPESRTFLSPVRG